MSAHKKVQGSIIRCYICKENKPREMFYHKRNRVSDGVQYLDQRCKPCCSKLSTIQRKKNPELYKKIGEKWRLANRDKARYCARRHFYRKMYGMTQEQYDELKATRNGICAMCNRVNGKLVLDHDHASGKVRDFLCNHCNAFIGHLEKYPDLLGYAIKYLAKHSVEVKRYA